MKRKLLLCSKKLNCYESKLKKLNKEKSIKDKFMKEYFKLLILSNKLQNVMEI